MWVVDSYSRRQMKHLGSTGTFFLYKPYRVGRELIALHKKCLILFGTLSFQIFLHNFLVAAEELSQVEERPVGVKCRAIE
jgi:hypothetical protein